MNAQKLKIKSFYQKTHNTCQYFQGINAIIFFEGNFLGLQDCSENMQFHSKKA